MRQSFNEFIKGAMLVLVTALPATMALIIIVRIYTNEH